jgi:hypothetical protein
MVRVAASCPGRITVVKCIRRPLARRAENRRSAEGREAPQPQPPRPLASHPADIDGVSRARCSLRRLPPLRPPPRRIRQVCSCCNAMLHCTDCEGVARAGCTTSVATRSSLPPRSDQRHERWRRERHIPKRRNFHRMRVPHAPLRWPAPRERNVGRSKRGQAGPKASWRFSAARGSLRM